MTNPTSNYGWQMPTATDLVTDLPADFEVFGQAVDTSLVDLLGGTTGQVLAKASNANMDFVWSADASGIPATILDAKGDIIAATAADTASRLAVGANNTVLTADSAQATGLKWATPTTAAKSYALLNAGGTNLTAATTITVSGLSGYDNLAVVVVNASASANSTFTMRFNTDSGANYVLAGPNLVWATTYASGNFSRFGNVAGTRIDIGQLSTNASSELSGGLLMFGANSTGGKAYTGTWGSSDGGGTSNAANTLSGLYMGTSVVSSVSIISDTGNFDAGKIYIYGAV
jgi:hypothetical protein